MRRWRNRRRDSRIIDATLRGVPARLVASAHGVCRRTVAYVLARFRRYGRPFPNRTKVCNEHSRPVHTRPHGARRRVSLNLHWQGMIRHQLRQGLDRRWQAIRARQLRALVSELARYGGRIVRDDGVGKWTSILRSSYEWLDRLADDPIPTLAREHTNG